MAFGHRPHDFEKGLGMNESRLFFISAAFAAFFFPPAFWCSSNAFWAVRSSLPALYPNRPRDVTFGFVSRSAASFLQPPP
ncbi:hypothetical protein TNCV_4662071 [Trichonephila clavipes]|uniref:Uncharacterized protein n=1 Tax=Trichonephila clavipes TaxID=2585209 RepID=A0A8X6SB65_TRICX|nr:hypothetical protein TNCV_4662071 [Trichonephila clavipes]